MQLFIDPILLSRLHAHAAATFPEECCGVMLGEETDDATRKIVDLLAVENSKQGERKRRYLIDPQVLLRAERSARERGLDVLGIYHSHPDHPSQPSEFDRVHAMPYWSYVIVSCMAGRCVQTQSWRLRDDRSLFDEEVLVT